MPYEKLTELPKKVKNNVPKHAQEIFRAAYNSAWEEYKDHSSRDGSREETAQKIAWAAVKKKYTKENDTWVKK